jgi:outer membrane protein assembly factor BamB
VSIASQSFLITMQPVLGAEARQFSAEDSTGRFPFLVCKSPMRVQSILGFAFSVLLITLFTETALAVSPNTWTRFHGVDGNGVVEDAQIPSSWSDSDYAWRRKLGSRDVGSPIVIDGKVYYLVSKPATREIAIESLDLNTGKLRWFKQYDQEPLPHPHARYTLASSTPAADQDNVFFAFAEPQHTYLKCLDHDGNEVWSRDFGSWQSQHGFGTSPRIFGSMVLLMNSQQADRLRRGETPGQSRMIAVDRKSGETIWETPLATTNACYGVPAIFEHNGRSQIIDANTGNGLFGLDPKTGRMLWNLKVFDMRCCSTPLIAGDLAIGSSGSGGGGNHLVAVRIPKSPSEKPQQVYRIDGGAAPYVPTSVLKDNRLYMIDDKGGVAACVNAQTGRHIWKQRIRGSFGASPILIGQTVLVISLQGDATLFKASDRFEKLGEVDLGGPVGATPAYSEGRLLLRVDDELRCLGGKAI